MTPTARIEAIGSRQTLALTALVDTGFDGYLCLPTRLAVQLGLELIGEEMIELADGTQRKELVFAGAVRFFGRTRDVQIMLTASEDGLIGTSLLNHYPLAIEFPVEGSESAPGPKVGKSESKRGSENSPKSAPRSHRWGEPKELVGQDLLLASDASSYVTGQVIVVDGGYQAR